VLNRNAEKLDDKMGDADAARGCCCSLEMMSKEDSFAVFKQHRFLLLLLLETT